MVDGFTCGSSGGSLGVVVSGFGFPVVSCWCGGCTCVPSGSGRENAGFGVVRTVATGWRFSGRIFRV